MQVHAIMLEMQREVDQVYQVTMALSSKENTLITKLQVSLVTNFPTVSLRTIGVLESNISCVFIVFVSFAR